MDFKLILLLLGLGQLVVIVLYALWGFLGGLKRELKCTAVLFVILLLGWLIFSDPAMMMGIELPGSLLELLGDLGVKAETASIWEVILQVLQTKVPNGVNLFVEGREAYELAYDVVAGVLRGVGLILSTVGSLFLAATIRFISHFVKFFVSLAKKAKAKKALPEEVEETSSEEEPEQVVVLGGIEGADDVIVTTDENEVPQTKPITKRFWGALVGAVKACVVLCITFVPLSGVVSILDETSDETRELISDFVSGDVQMTEGEKEPNVVDIVFDFVEDYKKSPLGLGVESTSYFFGDSFSTLLFDQTFYITTDSQRIPLRQELVTFIHAANALEGNIDYKNLEQEKLSNALDELKDSKLLPELMPVAIEFAYENEQVKEYLFAANQEAQFLKLRYIDWDKDIEVLLDAVKVIYSLDLFAEDFNVLTLDVDTVRQIVSLISSTELVENGMPIGVQVAVKLEAVQNLIKDPNFKPVLTDVDWSKDLDKLVDVYASFQEFGFTSLDGLNKDTLLEAIFEENKEAAVKDILSALVETDLFSVLVVPAAERIVDAIILEVNEGQFKSLVGVLPIKELSVSQWESDLHALVDVADKFYDLGAFGFKLSEMDLTSPEAIETLKYTIDVLFGTLGDEAQGIEATNGLNILQQEDALLKVVDWAFKNFDLVAPDAELHIDRSSINLAQEGKVLKELIDIYAELAKYEEFDVNNMKFDFLALLEKEEMGELVTRTLEALVESNIILNTLVPIIEHKVSPLLDGNEEAGDILDDILDQENASKVIIEEVEKIIAAVFAARDLGLLAVPRSGLKAIDFAQTEAMKTIVNALFDSKLFDGYEARILRVILKVCKIEVELELLDVDYDQEQALINGFIDKVAPILQNEAFEIFNDEGKFEFSAELKSFLLTEESAQILVDSLQILFGDHEAQTEGSKLAANLIKPLYHQFAADKVPADFKELVDTIDIDSFTAEELASDIRTLVYIADELVEFGVFGALDDKAGSIHFASNFAAGNGENIIRALAEINIIERRTNEILAYALNFAVAKYNESAEAKGGQALVIEKFEASDFANVVWADEVNRVVEAYIGAVELLEANGLTTVDEIKAFATEKDYLKEEFLTKENGHAVINIVEPLLNSQLVSILVNAAEEQIYQLAQAKGLNITGVLAVTEDELRQDLNTILGIARKAVDLGALEYIYNKDISNIDYEIIASILYDENGADLSDLVILEKSQTKLGREVVALLVSKVAPNLDFTITQGDLENTNVKNDLEKLSQVVVVLGEVIQGLDLYSLSDILEFVKDIKVNELLKDEALLNDANVDRISEVLALVSEMTYFEALSPALFDIVLDKLVEKLPEAEALKGSVTGAELAEDLKTLSSLNEPIKESDLIKFVHEELVYSLNQEAYEEIIETVLSLNVINNNNLTIVKIAVGLISDAVKVEGLEFSCEDYMFSEFTEETWASDQALLAEIVGDVLYIAFEELDIISIKHAKAFINDGEFKQIEFYEAELVEQLGDVVAKVISLETVGALLPSVLDYAVDLAKHAKVGDQELGLDILYILRAYDEGKLTNEMLAEDVITLVQMAVIALNEGVVSDVLSAKENNAFDSMELNFEAYAQLIEKLGELNILNFDSAKITTEIVNLALRLAKLDTEVVEKDFVHVTEEEWLADAHQLAEVLRKAEALLAELEIDPTIGAIKHFAQNDAKNYQNYLDAELVDALVETLQAALSFNAGEKLVGKLVDFALPLAQDKLRDKPEFVSVDLGFLAGTVSQATLHADVATLGAMAKEAIAFGLLEYVETKDIKDVELVHVANIVDLLGELNLYSQARIGWYENAALVATDATRKFFHLEDLSGINFEEDNEQLQAVIMQIDELLKANKHESLSEIMNFVSDLGATYEQWATFENGKAIVDILNGLADVDILMACGASTMEYVIYFALTKNIDIRFLYDQEYLGADLGADIRIIASILDEALEFGLIDLVWKYPIQKIDLSHVQNIVKLVDQLHIFGLDKAEWTSFLANFIGSKLEMNISVEAKTFAHVDWAKENASVVELIGKAQELLDANKFESTEECIKFIKEAAYLSNQYVTEENVELIAQALDILAELDVLEQLLPNLVEFAMVKLETGVSGDFTLITSEEFSTIAYMIREVAAFGAVEMYNNILWGEKYFYEGEFDLSHIVNVIKAIEELETFTIDRAHWVQFIATKLNIGYVPTIEELEAIDYPAENAKLVEIVLLIDQLMKDNYLTNLEFIYHWIELEGYKSAQYITDENVLLVAEILESVAELQLLVPFANEVLDLVFLGNEQTHYLVGQLEGEQVVEDLHALVAVVRELVEFKVIDLYYWQHVEEFKFDSLRNAIELVLNLNILNVKRAETMALVLNVALASIDASYTAEDFANINWEEEDATILAIYDQVVVLAREMNIEGTELLDAYLNEKLYLLAHYTNEITIGYAVDALELVASLQELPVVIDELAVVALSSVKGIDLTFLVDAIQNGELTDDELVADIHKVLEIAEDYLEYGLYNMAYGNEYADVDTDKFVEIFVKLDELHVLNEFRINWAVLATNKLFGSFVQISEAELVHLTDAMWADEIEVLANTIVKVYEFLQVRGYADNAELYRLYNELVKEEKYKDVQHLIAELIYDENGAKDEASVEALLDVVVEAAKSDVTGVVLHESFSILIEKLNAKGIDLTELPEKLSIAELQADVELIAEAAKELVMFGAIELYLEKGKIQYNEIDRVLNAIDALLNTNIANKDSGYLMGGILKDEASRRTGYFSNKLYLRDQSEAIQLIVEDLAYIALAQELNTLSDVLDAVKNIKSYKVKVNGRLSATLDALSEVLSTMGQDEFFAEAVLAGARGYLTAQLDKYPGLADVYKFYVGETLAEDLTSLANAIDAANELDLYAILSNERAIPYHRVDVLEAVLTEIMGLNYFNGKGRIEDIINGVGHALNADLSEFADMRLDLEADALGLVATYEALLPVIQNENWPYIYVEDFKTKSLDLQYVLSKTFINAGINAFNEFKETTIYQETNGAILVILLPVVKYVLPEYYEASNIKNCSIEQLVEDGVSIMAMVERVQESQVVDALRDHSTVIDFASATDDITYLLTEAINLNILANGAAKAVTELVLRDVVYGKTIAGITIYEGAFDLTEVDFSADIELLDQIMKQAVIVLNNSGINSLADIKAHMNYAGVKEIAMNEANLEAIATAMEKASEMTFIRANASSLWNGLVYPRLEASRFAEYAKYISYEGATNEQLVEDLSKGAEILRTVNGLGLVDAYNGAELDYNQVAEVEQLLTLISELNYLEINHERIYNFIKVRVEARGGVMFGIEEFTIREDLPKFAKVYEAALPILMDDAFPYTTLQDYLTVLRTRSIDKEELVEVAYANRSAVLDAYHVIREQGLGKYGLVLVLPAVKLVSPTIYGALNLEGYTYETLVNDGHIALEIAECLRHSQALDILRQRGSAVLDWSEGAEDLAFIMNKAVEMQILGNGSIGKLANVVLENYIYGKSVAGITLNDLALDFTNVDYENDAEVFGNMFRIAAQILENSDIHTLGEVKGLLNKAGVKRIVLDEVNLELIANMMEEATLSTFVLENATNIYERFVMASLEAKLPAYAKYASYEGATNEQLVEDLGKGAEILRTVNGLGLVDAYNGAELDYNQVAEVEQLLTLISELNYLEINHERIYNFIKVRVEARGGVMFGIEEFTIREDLPKFAKVYEAALPILMDDAFPYTTLQDYLTVLRTRSIDKEELVEVAYANRSAVLDAYHVIREQGLGKYGLVLVLPAVKLVSPTIYGALNLEGYTYETLVNDGHIALEIAECLRHSQALDILRQRGSAVLDWSEGAEDLAFIMNKAVEMQILGNGSIGKLANVVLENYIYGKSVAGITLNDLALDFTNVDYENDAEVFGNMFRIAAQILENSDIHTLGEVKGLLNKAGVKRIVLDEVNLELIANMMEEATLSTFVLENATNIYERFVMASLEAKLPAYAKYASYEGATNEQLVEDLGKGAEILRTVNGLGFVEVCKGAAINYDQADEVEQLLVLISELNYLEVNEDKIFNFIASKVSTLYTYNVSPEDLMIKEDLVKLADVYRASLPILTNPEYPFTTLKQYLDILRTRNIPSKGVLAQIVTANMQDAVNVYKEAVELDSVKYLVLPVYNKVKGLGVATSVVSLVDPSSLTLAQIEEDLYYSKALAQLVVNSGIKFGVKDSKLGLLASSEIDYVVVNQIVDELYYFNCLQGKFDAIVDVVASKLGLSLTGSYDAYDERYLVHKMISLVELVQNELGAQNLGELLAYYRDLTGTVDAVMADVEIQDAICDFISVASQTTLGKDLIVNAYNQLVKPSLPAEFATIINFDDPTYTPNLWSKDFENMFIVYNELKAHNFGEASFVLTFEETYELFNLVFITNAPHAIESNPEAWLEDVFFANLPAVGRFAPEYENVSDWELELLNIAYVIEALGLVFGQEKEVTSLTKSDLYSFDNVMDAYTLLDAITLSETMRTLILAVIEEAANLTSGTSAKIKLEDLLSAEFTAQISGSEYAYDEAFWASEDLTSLATVLVLVNHVLYDEFGNFDASAFDIANSDVLGDYTVGPIDSSTNEVDPTVNVGLGHVLTNMYLTKVFALDELAGPTGLIADELSALISDTSLIGEIDELDDVYDLLDSIVAINEATNKQLNSLGIETVYANIGSPEVVGMISTVQDSDVLKGALPFILHELVVVAANANSVPEALAFQGIKLFDAAIGEAIEAPTASNANAVYTADAALLVNLIMSI